MGAGDMTTLFFHCIGFSNQGFSFGVTNKLKLVFTIPKLSDEIRYVPAVELWIFPNLSGVSRNKIVEMTFIALASIPQASDDRTDTFSQTWNTNEDCVSLDLTGLNKKIYRVLHKKNLNESTVTLTIEIIARKTITSTMESNLLNHDLCSALSERSTNDSFLVIKNYNGEIAPASVGVDAGEESETESDIIIVGDEEGDEMLNSTANPSDLDACRVVPLVVNITDLYDFIEAPVQTNIGDCSGKCSLSLHRELFSQHAEIKERLKLLPGGEALSEYSPKCMPVHLSPLHALISLHSRSKVIVQFPDTVVDQCICQ